MKQSKDWASLLGLIYDAATAPEHWQNVVEEIRSQLGCESSLLISEHSLDPDKLIYANANIDPYWLNQYHLHYYQFDPSVPLFMHNKGAVLPDHVTSCDGALAKNSRVFYHEVMQPQEYAHTAAVALPVSLEQYHGLILTRTASQGAFRHDELNYLEMLSGHITKSASIGHRLAVAESIGDGIAEGLRYADIAVVLLDQKGSPFFCNDLMQTLEQKTGSFHLSHRGIRATILHEDNELQLLIKRSIETALGNNVYGGGATLLSCSDGSKLSARVHPQRQNLKPLSNAAQVYTAVFIQETRQTKAVNQREIQTHLGLTPTESAVAAALAQGLTTAEIAEKNCTKVSTVRGQLKAIYRKTGINRQSELVKAVLLIKNASE